MNFGFVSREELCNSRKFASVKELLIKVYQMRSSGLFWDASFPLFPLLYFLEKIMNGQ